MAKHTSGPWLVNPEDRTQVRDGFGITVALAVRAADAQLIAITPELLSLLIESQQSIGGDWRARRDAVLAKLEGK